MKEWLKHNVEPLSQVSCYMEKTVVQRAQWIRSNPGTSFTDIVREYPRLFDIPGMVEVDFRAMYSDVADSLCLQWTPTYVRNVIDYANLQSRWYSYLNVDATKLESYTDDMMANIALAVLPCILPSGRKGKKRSSIDEALSSFIDIKPVGTNMPKYLEEVVNTQPYILVFGTLFEPQQAFSIVERKAIQHPSILKSVDVCFKLFYVLDLDYPWQCATTWEFIQKAIFGLDDVKGASILTHILSG